MKNEHPNYYKPFVHNPFLVVITGLIIIFSVLCTGILIQSLLGYQEMPPPEFIIIPLLAVFVLGFGLDIQHDRIDLFWYRVQLYCWRNISTEWVQLKPTDKVESLRVERGRKSHLTPLVRKIKTELEQQHG